MLTLFTTPVISIFCSIGCRGASSPKLPGSLRPRPPCEYSSAVHQSAGGDHICWRSPSDCRACWRISICQVCATAECHLSRHRGAGVDGGRESGHHGLNGGRAALLNGAWRTISGVTEFDLHQHGRVGADHRPVRAEQGYQRRRTRCGSSHPGGTRRPSKHAAQ